MNIKENKAFYAAYFVLFVMAFVFIINAIWILLGSHVAQVLPASLLMFLIAKRVFFKGRDLTYIEPIYFCVILLVVGFADYYMNWGQHIDAGMTMLISLFLAFAMFAIRFRTL